MQVTFFNKLMSPVRFFAAGASAVLFSVLFLSAAPARAQGPIVVTGAPVQLGALTGGGWDGSQEPVGGTFVVGVNGNVLVGNGYGSNFLQITPTGTDTTLAAGVGGSAAALDSYGNLYFAGNYNQNIFKVPYDAATGAYVGWSGSAPTANCLGGNKDTSPCVFAPSVVAYMSGTLAGSGASGYAGVAFDGQGNFFFESNTLPGTDPDTIFECNLACIASSSATPKLIYSDANPVGAMQIDPWGNIFFVDGNNSKGKATNLNEIVLSSGTYASSPTVVLSYTNAAGYGNGISGLAVAGNGSLYISVNGDGLFAIPNTQSGGPSVSSMVQVATQGGKGVAVDANGNLYGIPYNGGDVVSFIPVSSFALGSEPIGTAATGVSATVIDNNGSCSSAPTLTAAASEFGKSTSEFSGTLGTSCSTPFGGGNGTFSAGPFTSTSGAYVSYSVSLGFTPTAAGERNAALSIADTTNKVSGTTALAGVGQGAIGNVDPGVMTTYTTGLTTPSSIVADAAGDVFVADSGAGKVFEFASGSQTSTTIGTGFKAPAALAFDASGNLFIADNGVPDVVEIWNTGTTGAFVAGTQQTLIASSTVFGGTPLEDAEALAFAPDDTLYISDTGNKRVVSYNPITGAGGVTVAQAAIQGLTSPAGLESPEGLAVDSSGNLYIADSTNNLIFVVWSGGVVTTVTPPSSIASAQGVAVDASGNMFVADASKGNIALVPNVSGTLTPSQAITIETVSPQASSLWEDSAGDLYVASAVGVSANMIQRTAASVNIGAVADGATQTATVYLENAGNAQATLATPDVTQPSNYPMFSLSPAATDNSCTAGTVGPAGAWCEFTAEFAPPAGTTATSYSGMADILIGTPSASIPVSISGTALLSAALPNSISFTPPASGYVGQVITLSATATSGLSVSFTSTSTSACTLTGSSLTFTATGTCSVTASQPQCANTCSNNANLYGAATPVTANITVSSITAAGVPSLVVNQPTWIGDFGSGGDTSGNNPAGGSLGVNTVNGDVIDGNQYGNEIQIWAPPSASNSTGYPESFTETDVTGLSGVGGASVDAGNNIYAGRTYWYQIYKVPFIAGAYVTTVPSAGVPNCAGGSADTAPCIFTANGLSFGETGVTAIAFDSVGDLFFVSEPNSSGQNGIYMIPAASLATITNGGVNSSVVYTSDSDTISGITLDANDNLFFTDSQWGATVGGKPVNMGSSESYASNLYELANSGSVSAPAYSNAAPGQTGGPVLLQAFTNSGPGTYDNIMSGVTADTTNGIVYFSTKSDGIWAFANNGTPFTATSLPTFYAVAGSNGRSAYAGDMTGGKVLAVGASSTLYAVGSEPGSLGYVDDLYMLTIGSVATPYTQYQGSPSSASAVVVDNGLAWCPTPGATLGFTFSGADASDFAGTQGTGCSAVVAGGGYDGSFATPANASSYPATITFTPLMIDAQTATMSVNDSANGGVGTATASGFAETTPQNISFSSPTVTTYTYSPAPSPVVITLSVGNGGSNFPVNFSIDPSSTGVGTLSSTTVSDNTSSAILTVTQAGSIVIDASEPGGLAPDSIYYSQSNTATLALTINPAAQTVTFTAITGSPFTYTASPQVTLQLSATGGASGNPVAFSIDSSSTGTGTISSTTTVGNASLATLTVTGAGSITIDANQPATADYAAATQVQQTIQVNQAAQTITLVPQPLPIYFIASTTGISGGIAIQVSAVGGASDNPIVFTVDPASTMMGTFGTSTVSGATSTAILTVPVQGNVVSGIIVIDATQPQSTNYAAVTVAPLGTITILPPLPTQIITFNNPGTQVVGTALTLSATATSGQPVSYTSTTTSVCTISGSAVSFATGITSASTCTIVAAQPGDNINWAAAPSVTQSFTVNPSGQSPNINLDLSLNSLTIQAGTVGVTQLTINSQNNFTGALSLACSGLPSGYTCAFNPSSASLAEGGAITTTLTVTPPATAAVVSPNSRQFIPMTALAVAICFLGFKKRSRLHLLMLAVFATIAMGAISACGGTTTKTTTTTTSSATITVAATGMAGASGTVQQTVTLTVIVE